MAKKLVLKLRKYRKFHRIVGITVAALLLVSAVTGILLSLKKDIDLIQPPTIRGVSEVLSDWKPIHELSTIALAYLHNNVSGSSSIQVDKIDVRPSKGMAKVIFDDDSWEVQIDGVSGKILSMGKRHSDWIERLHDGSIISDNFKLVAMNALGWGVLVLIFTGAWLYYGPGVYRKQKRANRYD